MPSRATCVSARATTVPGFISDLTNWPWRGKGFMDPLRWRSSWLVNLKVFLRTSFKVKGHKNVSYDYTENGDTSVPTHCKLALSMGCDTVTTRQNCKLYNHTLYIVTRRTKKTQSSGNVPLPIHFLPLGRNDWRIANGQFRVCWKLLSGLPNDQSSSTLTLTIDVTQDKYASVFIKCKLVLFYSLIRALASSEIKFKHSLL